MSEKENWSIPYIMHALHNKLAMRKKNMQQNSIATLKHDDVCCYRCHKIVYRYFLMHGNGCLHYHRRWWIGIWENLNFMYGSFEGDVL